MKTIVCTSCGFENPDGFKFCGQCGSPLIETTPQRANAPLAERRQITVLFCDLVGSTLLSHKIDPEVLREVVAAYHRAAEEAISRFDGHIAQYLGDGLLVYFGYPRAHEDEPRRAVHAALGILSRLKAVNGELKKKWDIELAARIGIHTGVVVVSEMGGASRRELLALGQTPNIAARLQAVAEPNTIIVSDATFRLVKGFFETRSIGRPKLKGVTTNAEAFRVVEELSGRNRFDSISPSVLTPFIGRITELHLLNEYWKQTREGNGKALMISGDAGIGKSRILRSFKEQLVESERTLLESHCSPYYETTSFHPLIDLLNRVFGLERFSSDEEKVRHVEEMFACWEIPKEESVPYVAGLLSLSLDERYEHQSVHLLKKRQHLIEGLVRIFPIISTKKPILWIMEDIHWVDPSTNEFLLHLIPALARSHILLVLTSRPRALKDQPVQGLVESIELRRLDEHDVERLMNNIAGGKLLPLDVRKQIVSNTDGIPLYVEEMTRTVLESNLLVARDDHYDLKGPLRPFEIPSTLHDSLMARLDSLSNVKEVVQFGATIGREFSYTLIKQVMEIDDATLQTAIMKLKSADLLYQIGEIPNAQFQFKHALIQEAAYQSLLISQRQVYHKRIAEFLEKQSLEVISAQPELLARHYSRAGLVQSAVFYLHLAAMRAAERSAMVEASRLLREAQSLIPEITDEPLRKQLELDVLSLLAPTLIATEGYGCDELESIHKRCIELSEEFGNETQLLISTFGLWLHSFTRADLDRAWAYAQRVMEMASASDPSQVISAHIAVGLSHMQFGRFREASRHLEISLGTARDGRVENFFLFYGQDPVTVILAYYGLLRWLLGFPAQAHENIQHALELARMLNHPFSLAFTLAIAAEVSLYLGKFEEAGRYIVECIALSDRYEFPYWNSTIRILYGTHLVQADEVEKGLAMLEEGFSLLLGKGGELSRVNFNIARAVAYEKLGRIEEALECVNECLSLSQQTSIRFRLVLIHCAHGRLLLRLPSPDLTEVERIYRTAIDLANELETLTLELIATMHLVKFLMSTERADEGLEMLEACFNRFTEGFDFPILQQARAMLDELRAIVV